MFSCLPHPCSTPVSQRSEEVFLGAGDVKWDFISSRAVWFWQSPCSLYSLLLHIHAYPKCSLLGWTFPGFNSGLSSPGEGNPFEKGEFWAELQQLKWSNAVLKDRAKVEELWRGAGASWLVNLGTVTGK